MLGNGANDFINPVRSRQAGARQAIKLADELVKYMARNHRMLFLHQCQRQEIICRIFAFCRKVVGRKDDQVILSSVRTANFSIGNSNPNALLGPVVFRVVQAIVVYSDDEFFGVDDFTFATV